jgi:hypothetical protein
MLDTGFVPKPIALQIKCSNAGEFSGNGFDENQNGHIDDSYLAADITTNYA